MIGANPRQQTVGDRGRIFAEAVPSGVKTMHAAGCSIWDVPAGAQPDALMAAGVSKEEIAAYLSEVRPLYDAAKRCIGQLSGLLLLLQTDCLERERDGLLIASVTEQLGEAGERLRAIKVPASADRHRAALANLLVLLRQIVSRLDRLRDMVDPASPDLDAVVEALFAAQRTLHVVSMPEVGLAPVDFSAACCNCRQKRN